ncbi:MAG TPA: PIN domain-containing protein [Candidatus Baltobacteraceae bacterium]|jgi:predicted nucleic acid-binding protein|nr:PIN domain-containing protein [Candidatus Baltobacteraceae bacterium]
MRVFLDANILFSAALPDSRMRAFLDILMDRAKCLTNEYAIEEARRNLVAKFPETLKALERLAKKCEVVLQLETDLKVEMPLKDAPILGGAIAGHATHLLTGDERDFGKFWGQTIQGVKIVSPRMLAEELRLS